MTESELTEEEFQKKLDEMIELLPKVSDPNALKVISFLIQHIKRTSAYLESLSHPITKIPSLKQLFENMFGKDYEKRLVEIEGKKVLFSPEELKSIQKEGGGKFDWN